MAKATVSERAYKVSGKAFSLLVAEARKVSDTADGQRAFIELCMDQLQNDMRNM